MEKSYRASFLVCLLNMFIYKSQNLFINEINFISLKLSLHIQNLSHFHNFTNINYVFLLI